MKIKSKDNQYLLDPETLMNLTGISSEKYAIANMAKSTLQISDITEDMLDATWAEIEEDRRKLKKLKKSLLSGFAGDKMEDYKNSDLISNTLRKKFINTSEISEVLKNAMKNSMNLVIYGKGGYGKSEMVTELFSGPEFKDMVFVKSLSEATTEEDLFGGINVKKLSETGVVEFNCENSFANKEIVVFEEIFDANPRVLAALKDTLTAKEIRNGNQRFPMKTKVIIGLTNRTYEEVIQDDSTEALTQRFPLSFKLEYNLTEVDVAALTLNRYPEIDAKKMMGILEWHRTTPAEKMTPRKVLELAKYMNGIDINPERKYTEMVTNNPMTKAIEYVQHKKGFTDETLSLALKMMAEKAKAVVDRKENVEFDFIRDIKHKADIIERRVKAMTEIKKTLEVTKEAAQQQAELTNETAVKITQAESLIEAAQIIRDEIPQEIKHKVAELLKENRSSSGGGMTMKGGAKFIEQFNTLVNSVKRSA